VPVEFLLDRRRVKGVVEDEVAQVSVTLKIEQFDELDGEAIGLGPDHHSVGADLDRLGEVNGYSAGSPLGQRHLSGQPEALKTDVADLSRNRLPVGNDVDRNVGVHACELAVVHTIHSNRVGVPNGDKPAAQTIVQPPSTVSVDLFAMSATSLANITSVFVFAFLGAERSAAHTVLFTDVGTSTASPSCTWAPSWAAGRLLAFTVRMRTKNSAPSARRPLTPTSGATPLTRRNPHAIPLVRCVGSKLSHIPPPKGSHVAHRTVLWTR